MARSKPEFWEVEVRVRPAGGRWKSTWKGSAPKKKRLSAVVARAGNRLLVEHTNP